VVERSGGRTERGVHDDVTEILKPEIPEYIIPYIDDVPIKGPKT
jgi:hypothetical protein